MEEFEFENNDFSDSILHVEIFPDDCLDFKSDSGNSASIVDGRTLSISSPVLAAKSTFFYKLIKNAVKESQEKNITIQISASEESYLMDILNFMYTYKLRATTFPDLLKVLIVSNKFEVTCCMRYCCDLLLKLPMSLELAIEYLNLPPAVLMDQSVQPLKDAAEKFTTGMFNLQESAMWLSLSDVEILLARDELRVYSEDYVYDFIDRWTHAHYPGFLELQETMNSLCIRFLRFHYLSFEALDHILMFLDEKQVSEKVHDALCFKAGLPFSNHQQQQQPRMYKVRPLKVTHLQYLYPHCVAFLDLKKDECAGLFPDKHIDSEYFTIRVSEGSIRPFLTIHCGQDEQGLDCLGVVLRTWPDPLDAYYYWDIELAVLVNKPSRLSEYKLLYSTWRDGLGENDARILWSEFMAEENGYFMNDVVRFRAEVVLKPY